MRALSFPTRGLPVRYDPWLTRKQMREQREAIVRAGGVCALRDAGQCKPISGEDRPSWNSP